MCGPDRSHSHIGFELVEFEDVAVGIAKEARQAPSPVDRPLGNLNAFTLGPIDHRLERLYDERAVRVAWPFDRLVEKDIVAARNAVEDEVDPGAVAGDHLGDPFAAAFGVEAKAEP